MESRLEVRQSQQSVMLSLVRGPWRKCLGRWDWGDGSRCGYAAPQQAREIALKHAYRMQLRGLGEVHFETPRQWADRYVELDAMWDDVMQRRQRLGLEVIQ